MTPGWKLDPDGNRLQHLRQQRRQRRLGCLPWMLAVVGFWLAVYLVVRG